ncbi:uncharacterized protein LOC126905999 [Daktulosphaira vitifoliae]|uniref:uncharacterized protein LOC126905999 n=1 Tax=Daktulosphaira vitifoliae TaxID=58002 RepID=UPI0021A9A796|nr:uncharacterized protein LOC126905999 [Daktulosphaira vitifoliae]
MKCLMKIFKKVFKVNNKGDAVDVKVSNQVTNKCKENCKNYSDLQAAEKKASVLKEILSKSQGKMQVYLNEIENLKASLKINGNVTNEASEGLVTDNNHQNIDRIIIINEDNNNEASNGKHKNINCMTVISEDNIDEASRDTIPKKNKKGPSQLARSARRIKEFEKKKIETKRNRRNNCIN